MSRFAASFRPTRARIAGAVCLGLLVAACAASPAAAGRQVVFHDARVLIADDTRVDGDTVIIAMGGGGELRVPAAAVAEIRDWTPPPAEVAAAEAGEPVGPPAPDWRERAGALADHIEKTARAHELEPALLLAVALQESKLRPDALSPKGAQGVMQLMPATARLLKVRNVWDAHENIEAGARWLRRLLTRFNGDLELALAAYNAGEETVRRFGGVPPYPETRTYVRRIRAMLEGFAAASRGPSA